MAISNFSWVMPGALAGCALPGGSRADYPHYVASDLKELSAAGVTAIVSLEQVGGFFSGLCAGLNLEWTPFFLTDFSVPVDVGAFDKLIGRITDAVEEGAAVCIHCRAGIGRTGLVLCCALGRYFGLSGPAAIRAVRKGRKALDTADQERFVCTYLDADGGA